MCTITFVPVSKTSNDFILTSNRDEAVGRKTLKPRIYSEEGVKLIYPKDAVAGGTWIGVSEWKRVICLMNGGFKKHIRKPFYKKSRGLVVKNLLSEENLRESFEKEVLKSTEPFTCIIVEWKTKLELHQLVWDGEKKHFSRLPVENNIWGSSFLYSAEVRESRKQAFRQFLKENKVTAENILKFHSSEEDENAEGIVINRGNLKTCSITQVIKSTEVSKMTYKDLLQEGKPTFETLIDF